MKIKIISTICILALGAALVQPNPAAAQASKPASTVSLADLKTQFAMLQTEITSAVEALNYVKDSAKKPAELSKAAGILNRSFDALQTRVNTLQTNAVSVKARVKEHYEAWSKQLTAMGNANLREKAQERLTESQKEYDKIVAQATEAKEQVLPFVSAVKDIVIYLGADLSEEAVKSLSSDIWKLGNRSKSVNSSIQDVVEQIDRTIKSLPQK
jgi:hypothetical protein